MFFFMFFMFFFMFFFKYNKYNKWLPKNNNYNVDFIRKK